MTITTGTFPKALREGLKSIWGRTYDEYNPKWAEMFKTENSFRKYEEDVEATGFGLAPVKAEGGNISYEDDNQGTVNRATNIAYALGFIVTYEEMEDNLYEEISEKRTEALAYSMRQTKEVNGANIMNRAFNSSFTYGDGVELIATNHPTFSGDQSNELSPAADLSEASLEDLTIQIMNAKNSKGLRIALMPESLIVPNELAFDAQRILESTLQNDSANNAINVLYTKSYIPKIVINPYLTDTDAFFIKTDAPRGLIHYERTPATFDADNDFDTKNMKFSAYERYVFTSVDFRGVYGSEGA